MHKTWLINSARPLWSNHCRFWRYRKGISLKSVRWRYQLSSAVHRCSEWTEKVEDNKLCQHNWYRIGAAAWLCSNPADWSESYMWWWRTINIRSGVVHIIWYCPTHSRKHHWKGHRTAHHTTAHLARWETRTNTEGEVHQFLIRYNQMLSNRNRGGSCTNCDCDLVGVEWVEMDDTDQTYGLQNYICCRCMKIYCYLCRAVDMNIVSMLETCDQCERVCCQECTTTLFCDYCDIYHCADCKDVVECSRSDCNYKVCADCMEICDKCKKCWCSDCFTVQSRCPICPERLCSDCSREKGVTPATFCGTCGTDHCDSCC